MQVRASSPSCRNTDPKAVVSGLFLRNNFAGPRYEDGQLQSWWLVDLGPGHRLIINYYTLRHDGSQDFLRNWVLEVGCASRPSTRPCVGNVPQGPWQCVAAGCDLCRHAASLRRFSGLRQCMAAAAAVSVQADSVLGVAREEGHGVLCAACAVRPTVKGYCLGWRWLCWQSAASPGQHCMASTPRLQALWTPARAVLRS